jgi:hypothetical protein
MKEFGDHFLIVGEVLKECIRKEEFEPLLQNAKRFQGHAKRGIKREKFLWLGKNYSPKI